MDRLFSCFLMITIFLTSQHSFAEFEKDWPTFSKDAEEIDIETKIVPLNYLNVLDEEGQRFYLGSTEKKICYYLADGNFALPLKVYRTPNFVFNVFVEPIGVELSDNEKNYAFYYGGTYYYNFPVKRVEGNCPRSLE